MVIQWQISTFYTIYFGFRALKRKSLREFFFNKRTNKQNKFWPETKIMESFSLKDESFNNVTSDRKQMLEWETIIQPPF